LIWQFIRRQVSHVSGLKDRPRTKTARVRAAHDFSRDLRESNIHGARIWQYPSRRMVLSVRIASIFARCVMAHDVIARHLDRASPRNCIDFSIRIALSRENAPPSLCIPIIAARWADQILRGSSAGFFATDRKTRRRDYARAF